MKGTVPVGGVWKRSLLLCRGKNSCRVCRSVNGRKKMCQFIHNWLQCANSWQRCHEIEVSLSADGWMALWSSNLHILCVCVCVVLYICTHQTSKCKSITEGQRWAVKVTAHPVCVLAFSNQCHCEFLQTSSANEPSFVCFLSSLSSPSHHHPGSHLLFWSSIPHQS